MENIIRLYLKWFLIYWILTITIQFITAAILTNSPTTTTTTTHSTTTTTTTQSTTTSGIASATTPPLFTSLQMCSGSSYYTMSKNQEIFISSPGFTDGDRYPLSLNCSLLIHSGTSNVSIIHLIYNVLRKGRTI